MQHHGNSEYDATIELAGSPESAMPARITLADGVISVTASGQEIGSWQVSQIDVSRVETIVTLDVEGETLLIEVEDTDRFADQLGAEPQGPSVPVTIPRTEAEPEDHPSGTVDGPRHRRSDGPAPWWQFWRIGAWRDWLDRRKRWREYRGQVDPVRTRIRQIRATITEQENALAEAERKLSWARELRPIDVPIRLRGAETAVATFSDVQLYVPRQNGSKAGWMPVDRGTLHVTDRRLVFSGEEEVPFEFAELTSTVKTSIGLLVGVASRNQEYMISGPSEQLAVVLEAAHRGGRGLAPTAPFSERVEEARAGLERSREDLRTLRGQASAVEAPIRPISPAWMPLASLALVAVVGFGMAGRVPSVETMPAADPGGDRQTVDRAAEADTPAAGREAEVLGLVLAAPAAGPSGDPSALPPEAAEPVETVAIIDGDELEVRRDDGTIEAVRLIGVQAPQRDECFAQTAADTLAVLLPPGATAHLTSEGNERDSFGRLRRLVWLGSLSVNEELLRRGVATTSFVSPDAAMATRLREAQTAARTAEMGLWAPGGCGAREPLELTVIGIESGSAEGDSVRIRNTGGLTVDLTGWTVESESGFQYDFPTDFSAAPDEVITIHSGCGTDFATDLHMCEPQGWAAGAPSALLVDPSGRIMDEYQLPAPESDER